jgi:hypothetical protein
MEKKKLLNTDDNFEIYIDFMDDSKIFAIDKLDNVVIENLLAQFDYMNNIPDNFTVNCLKIGIIKENESIEEYNIVDYTPISIQINKLRSASILKA